MVHTRHSYSKDLPEKNVNGHQLKEGENEKENIGDSMINDDSEKNIKCSPSSGPVDRDDHGDDESQDQSVNNEQEKETTVAEPRKKRKKSLLGFIDNYDYHDSVQRRSLRNISRQERSRRHYNGPSHRSLKHVQNMRFQHLGSSLIRRSDRHPKKVFDTFNELEIQRVIDRKHQELLDAEHNSMYDSIKRRSGELSDTQEDDSEEQESEEEDEEESGEEESGEEEDEVRPGYSLRKTKPKTNIYQAPPLQKRQKREIIYDGPQSPLHKRRHIKRVPQHASSPRRQYKRNRRSSSTSSSDDEAGFERRKAKSMAQARSRCLPMNFTPDAMVGVLKNRERAREGTLIGSSLADVDPMIIDTKISFADIGGLDRHIHSLKEMIVFPLLYPEVFEKFSIAPPRGVLFYGPPGTGKTLVARALANECSSENRKVAFFMRKGADCLSKWVGESERQLRLLFDQAYSMRPSIIFFDEIDGIAPVRSTRQDQIHSSIVSTLLALMDGLDARGEIVIIGATNRLDSIDPALRRPGRFDREFLFSLPNRKARQKICEIHTSAWKPKLSKEFISEVADKCVGYCGADIKALCTETALFALRRRYPQIYETNKKLVLNLNEINISAVDFKTAMRNITPASHRAEISPGKALPEDLKPLLITTVNKALALLHQIFPQAKPIQEDPKLDDIDSSDEDEASNVNIFENKLRNSSTNQTFDKLFLLTKNRVDKNRTHRPRLLIYGNEGNGQTSYIAPVLLFTAEHIKTYVLDLPALFASSSRTPEEAVAQVFREARRTSPSIIYLPHIGVWWNSVHETVRATFVTLLQDVPPSIPLLLLATADIYFKNLPESIQDLFLIINHEIMEVNSPTSTERYDYFKDLLLIHALKAPTKGKEKANKVVEILKEASPPKPRQLSKDECKLLQENEETHLRELRLFLRQITWKLLADRKFKEFTKPVDLEEVDDYLTVVKEPMALSTVMTRINSHHYNCCAHYLKDIDLIMNNCLEYNPDKDQFDKLLRNRACEMRDVAYALVNNDLDPEFEKICMEIYESRKKRGMIENPDAPSFMKVMPRYPKSTLSDINSQSSSTKMRNGNSPSIPDPVGTRFSRRVRSDPVDFDVNCLDIIERRKSKSIPKQTSETMSKETNKCESGFSTSFSTNCCLAIPTVSEKLNTVDENVSMRNDNKLLESSTLEESDASVILLNKTVENLNEVSMDICLTSGDSKEVKLLLNKLVEFTAELSVTSLERVYTQICRCISRQRKQEDRSAVLQELKEIIEMLQ